MAAAATTALGSALLRRLAVLVVVCATLAAAMPSKNKEGNEAVAVEGDECVSGHRKVDGESDCGANCYCLGGHWVCPECVNEGPSTKKLRSEDLEPAPLRRSKRETSDMTAIVIAERCVPHTRFRMDCNTCLCPTSGIQARASCTTGPCPTTRPPPSTTPAPVPTTTSPAVPSAPSATDPNAPSATDPSAAAPHPPTVDLVVDAPASLLQLPTSTSSAPEAPTTPTSEAPPLEPCTWEEKMGGNTSHCVPVPLDGERCAPGVTYMDECNTCICSQDGIKAHASCTFKVCPK